MSAEEAAESLTNLAELIAVNIPDFTQESAITAKALIQERIQEGGQNSELASFPAYSPGYKKYKAKKQGNEAAAFRNLTLSGDMWRKTNIKSAGLNGLNYEVVIGGTTQDAQDKINFNAEQIGDFLSVSEKEEQVLKNDYDEKLDKLIAEAGLA